MSDFPTHLVRDLKHKAFGAEERIVLFVLADRMKSTEDAAWPKVETIASNCGISERTARDVISWLLDIGVLLVHRSENDTGGVRALKIDFVRLGSLPDNTQRRCAGTRKASPRRSGAPVDRKRAPLDRNGAHTETSSQPGAPLHSTGAPPPSDRQGAPVGVRPLPPKDPSKEQQKGPTEDSAREAPRDTGGSTAPKKRTPDPRASRWPDGFELDAEMIAYATDRGMNGPKHAADEFERFRHYHQSKGSKFVVWKLAWYTWVRNWDDRRNRGSPVQRSPKMTSMQSEGPLFEPGNGASDMAKAGW
jgi:hypothetical protein